METNCGNASAVAGASPAVVPLSTIRPADHNYMTALDEHALGNYYDVMKMTLTPAMGHYLDMVNNDKLATGQHAHANENYARELMQLFTAGAQQIEFTSRGCSNPGADLYAGRRDGAGLRIHRLTFLPEPGQSLVKTTLISMAATCCRSNRITTAAQDIFGDNPDRRGTERGATGFGVLTIIFTIRICHRFAQQLIEKLVTSNPSPARGSRRPFGVCEREIPNVRNVESAAIRADGRGDPARSRSAARR